MLYRQNLLQGALLILLSELAFASMGATVKAASASLPNEMLVFMRNLFGVALVLPLVWHGGGRTLLCTDNLGLHLLRAGSGLSAMYCFFYALGHLPLAEGMLLKMTTPLFIPLIAIAWLGERAAPLALWGLPIGFIGVLLVLAPDGEFNRVALIGLLGGALAALAKVSVRRLSHSEPTLRVVFYFALFGALASSVPLLWAWQSPSGSQWLLLLLLGVFGTTGQLLLTRGYAVATSGDVAPFTYFSVLFGTAYGYLLWGEIPRGHFVLGALLIAGAGLLALRKTYVRSAPTGHATSQAAGERA